MAEHKVLRLDEIDDGASRRVEIGDHLIALVRLGDSVYAVGDTCSHEKVSLAEGFVDADECTIECWRHGASFDLRSGAPTSLPAVIPVPVYEVSIVDGDVWVSVSDSDEKVS